MPRLMMTILPDGYYLNSLAWLGSALMRFYPATMTLYLSEIMNIKKTYYPAYQ